MSNPFMPPVLETAPRIAATYAGVAADHAMPVSAVQPHFAAARPDERYAAVVQHAAQAEPQTAAAAQDWAAQIEQLRNDIFGIAMSVSALTDRLDRMEQRLPQAVPSVQAGLATLRGEIEIWLESHLNTAVEHCMHRVASRTNSAASPTVN